MKRILVTGAGGMVGYQVVRFLLSEGKYEITVLDLKTKNAYKRLRSFRKRLDIVYGDINDVSLIDSLVKETDVVIHLAGIIPPLANIRDDLCERMDYGGTKLISDSIKKYNPNCQLIYASSTSVYGFKEKYEDLNVSTKCELDDFDSYSKTKLKCEDYIKDNVKNYTIFRVAYVLGDPKKDAIIYTVNPNSYIETISAEDAGYAFVCAIDKFKELNGKIFNLSGGEKFRTKYKDYLIKIFKTYGLSLKYFFVWLLAEKNYFGGFYPDGDKLEEILNFRSKNLDVYYESLDKYKSSIFRIIPRLLALPFVCRFNKNKKEV